LMKLTGSVGSVQIIIKKTIGSASRVQLDGKLFTNPVLKHVSCSCTQKCLTQVEP